MFGSAVTVLNAPYHLLEKVQEILPKLHEILKQSDKARSFIEIYENEQ
jgi:23S rRNA A2030 N6-methylase RlmJ